MKKTVLLSGVDATTPRGHADDFEATFRAAMADLKAMAKAAGVSINELCRDAGISRACPDRWARKPPKTVRMVRDLQRALKKKIAAKVAANAG